MMPYKDYEQTKKHSQKYYAAHRKERLAYAKKWGVAYEKTDKCKLYRQAFYQATRQSVWRRYSVVKSRAKKFKYDFTLSKEDYAKLIANPCSYCGGALPEAGGGLDRLDNRMGYVHGNVVPCCEFCNEKKGRLEGIGFRYPRTVELLKELVEFVQINGDL